LYAEAGIPEYWVINIADRTLTVFSDRQNNDFAKQDTVSSGIIHPVACPEVAIEVQKLVSIPE
ncbi:MAG: Uma2 family endonuclease, partial [Cyanobacteria bacterium P01_A01_bin.17]